MSNFILTVLLVIIVVIVFVILIYNSIISSKNKVEENKSTISVYLQKRYDLIPNLVEIIKKYMEYEKGLLREITELRTNLVSNSWDFSKDRFSKENQLSNALKTIFAVWENYPDLKANQSFVNLQKEWADIEDNIAAARRSYNAAIKVLNDKKLMIPYNFFASRMNIPEYPYFEAEDKAKEKIDINKLFNK